MDKSRIRRAVSTVYRFLNSIADPFLFHPVGKLVLLLTIAATFAISVERRFEVGELSRITAPLQHYGCDYTVSKETGAVSIGYCEDYPLPITYYIGDAAQERLVQHIVSDMAPLLDDEERASIQWMLKNQASLNRILLHAQHEDSDGDDIPNLYDECPDIRGKWGYFSNYPPFRMGCPGEQKDTPGESPATRRIDTDMDGIDDPFDKCPREAGYDFGHPHKHEGLPVFQDPETYFELQRALQMSRIGNDTGWSQDAWLFAAEYYGCPVRDEDNDLIPDHLDLCPRTQQNQYHNGTTGCHETEPFTASFDPASDTKAWELEHEDDYVILQTPAGHNGAQDETRYPFNPGGVVRAFSIDRDGVPRDAYDDNRVICPMKVTGVADFVTRDTLEAARTALENESTTLIVLSTCWVVEQEEIDDEERFEEIDDLD